MGNADKRIPVTEETWRDLHSLKEAGQTFDELVSELIEERKKAQFVADMEERRDGEFVELRSADE